jgi:GntR family transcriptional regulator
MSWENQSPIPLYFKILSDFKEKIFSGEWQYGFQIPSEADLAKQLEVSVITVRQAMRQLVSEGFIYRVRGKGSFVNWRGTPRQTIALHFEDRDNLSNDPLYQLLAREKTKVPARLAEKFGKGENAEVYKIVRVRMQDEKPIAYIMSHLPCKIASLLEDKVLTRLPLVTAVETCSSVRFTHVSHGIRVVLSDADVARKLDLPAGAPVLLIERDYFSEEGIIMISSGYYRSDLYRYEVKLGIGHMRKGFPWRC